MDPDPGCVMIDVLFDLKPARYKGNTLFRVSLPNVRMMCTLKYECHQMHMIRTGVHSFLKVYAQSTFSVLSAHFERTVHSVHAAGYECNLLARFAQVRIVLKKYIHRKCQVCNIYLHI